MAAGSKCCNDGWVCKCDMSGHGFTDAYGVRVPNRCRCAGCGPCRKRHNKARRAARRAKRRARRGN